MHLVARRGSNEGRKGVLITGVVAEESVGADGGAEEGEEEGQAVRQEQLPSRVRVGDGIGGDCYRNRLGI